MAGSALEPPLGGANPGPGREAGASQVSRLGAHAGSRVPGARGGAGSEPGDAAAMADGGGDLEKAAATGRGSASVAGAPCRLGGTGAVGQLGTRLAGRAGAKAVPGGDDRRRDPPSSGSVGRA